MKRLAFLVDTNVWFDAELGKENRANARAFLSTAQMCGVRLGIASHSLKDLFVLVEKKLKFLTRQDDAIPQNSSGKAARIAAWATVEKLLGNVEVVGSDYSDAYLAMKHRAIHDDYEDALVIAAAMRMGADLLVTSDQDLLKHAPVAALSPQDATRWLEGLELSAGR